jgi:ribosomal protein S18 acetylase RimI-like enzyme
MVEKQLIELNHLNNDLLIGFLKSAGKSLETFRYFDSRDISIINNHLVTYVLKVNEQIVGYGHLEDENEKTWLGIAVIEAETGKGLGKYILKNLLESAIKNNIKTIHLTCDIKNNSAISMYTKFGFEIVEELKNNIYLMKVDLS